MCVHFWLKYICDKNYYILITWRSANYLHMITFSCILILEVFGCVSGARILGVMPTPSFSHQVVFHPLWRELSLRGHQITVMTTDPMRDPSLTNLTEIDLSEAYVPWNKMNIASFANISFIELCVQARSIEVEWLTTELENPKVQDLFNSKEEHFDLVLAEAFYPVMYPLSLRFDCPVIGIASLDAMQHLYQLLGNPTHPILYTDMSVSYTTNLSFWERVHAVFDSFLFSPLLWKYVIMADQQELVEKYFGKDYPNVWYMLANMSMLFINTDPIFHPVRPLLPSIIQIGGGTHIKPPKPLPETLQDELDSAKHGVIYFSLGSNVKSKDLTDIQKSAFLETFAELPYKVLWKFELEDLPDKPPNIYISKWFPQGDVIRHPNVKLFITQGGQQSIEEAVFAHVPMVGIPFFVDQPKNVQKIVDKGMGVMVKPEDLNKNSLRKAILEVLTNDTYRNTVRHLARLVRDEPMNGLEKAVWWTEYVIRHKGAPHFRSPLLEIYWYQYYMLDVIGFCVLAILSTLYILIKMSTCVKRTIKKVSLVPKTKQQ